MGGVSRLFPDSKQHPKDTLQKARRLYNNNFHNTLLSYLRKQAQPQPMSRNATRNKIAPTGKIAVIRIPHPSAKAEIPRTRHQSQRIPPSPSSFLRLTPVYTAECKYVQKVMLPHNCAAALHVNHFFFSCSGCAFQARRSFSSSYMRR